MRRMLASLAALLVGCTVFVDTGDLSGGSAASDASITSDGGGGQTTIDDTDGGRVDDTGAGPAAFSDLFDRPDGVVGNGWLENEADTFSLQGGRVVAKSGFWVERFLHRPASEDVRDVETSVEIRWWSTPGQNFDATLMSRIQRTNGKIFSYASFIDDGKALAISRVDASREEFVATKPLGTRVNTTDTYRMSLRVQGTMPVSISTTFERQTVNGWEMMATNSYSDDSAQRIEGPGSCGITSDANATFSYDTFTRTNLASP